MSERQSLDYDAGLRHPWVVSGDGGSWSITSTNGDVIASEIPHGIVADYIADLHNSRVPPPGRCPSCGSVAGYADGPPCLTCHYDIPPGGGRDE